MSEKETYISSLRSFPSYLKILLEQFVALLAFCPPIPASYTYERTRIRTVKGWAYLTYKMVLTERVKDILLPRKYDRYCELLETKQKSGQIKPYFVNTSRGNSLFCVRMSHSNISRSLKRPQNRFTIVYSHPNGCDLGLIIGTLYRMSKRCQCDVIAYDYSGYGCSSGKPSERNLYADMEAVCEDVVRRMRISKHRIILYGESIGSVPAIDMASRLRVGGVILHAALMSGLRTYYNYSRPTWTFDPFPNIERISQVSCPVLVIHGLKDYNIDISHGISLYLKCKHKVSPLWLKDANHSDVRAFPPYWQRIQYFFKECIRFQRILN